MKTLTDSMATFGPLAVAGSVGAGVWRRLAPPPTSRPAATIAPTTTSAATTTAARLSARRWRRAEEGGAGAGGGAKGGTGVGGDGAHAAVGESRAPGRTSSSVVGPSAMPPRRMGLVGSPGDPNLPTAGGGGGWGTTRQAPGVERPRGPAPPAPDPTDPASDPSDPAPTDPAPSDPDPDGARAPSETEGPPLRPGRRPSGAEPRPQTGRASRAPGGASEPMPSSRWRSSAADWILRAGFLASRSVTTRSRPLGTPRTEEDGLGGFSLRWARAVAMSVSPAKGGTPTSISYSTTPRE